MAVQRVYIYAEIGQNFRLVIRIYIVFDIRITLACVLLALQYHNAKSTGVATATSQTGMTEAYIES